jgi:hypothetical protein
MVGVGWAMDGAVVVEAGDAVGDLAGRTRESPRVGSMKNLFDHLERTGATLAA